MLVSACVQVKWQVFLRCGRAAKWRLRFCHSQDCAAPAAADRIAGRASATASEALKFCLHPFEVDWKHVGRLPWALEVAGCLNVSAPRSCSAPLINPACDLLTFHTALVCSQQLTRDPGPAAARHAAVRSPGRVVQGGGAGAGDNCQPGVPVEAVRMLTGKSSFWTRGRQAWLSPGLREQGPGLYTPAAALAHICASSQMWHVKPPDPSSLSCSPCLPGCCPAALDGLQPASVCGCFAWLLE